jgi:hypothetical protein
MKETFEYIDLISQTIDKTIKIKSVVVNLDNTIDLQVNKTLWLTISNRPIVIDNVEYKIKSIINNALIKLEPNLTPVTATEFQAYDFYYFHGTLTEVNIELNQIADSFLKFPMLYLVEVLEEENNTNDIEVVQRRVNARLLFATETDYVNNNTAGLYSTGIYPVRNFVNEFIYACENSPYINDLPDTYRSIPLTRIARYDANGHVSKLVNSQLTGIELRIELPLTDCDCCDVQPTTLALQGNENIFLTCGTLADCPIIETIGEVLEDHEERIEALEEGGGGGLTCETLPNCQTIIDINNNFDNYLPLAGGGTITGLNGTMLVNENGILTDDTFQSVAVNPAGISFNETPSNRYKGLLFGNIPIANINLALPDFSGTLALLSDITSALTGYATELYVNSQGFITNVITALGYTPENVANKATNLTSPDNTKYPTTQAVADGLSGKEDTITAGTTSQYYRGDKTFQTLDKTAVGLGNVDNTSDLNKPISTATQTALDKFQVFGKYELITHTGTVVKTLVASFVIPANTVEVGDALCLKYWNGRPAAETSNITFSIEIDGKIITNQVQTTSHRNIRGMIDLLVVSPTSTVGYPSASNLSIYNSAPSSQGNTNFNIDWTQNQTVEVYATLVTITDNFIHRITKFEINKL